MGKVHGPLNLTKTRQLKDAKKGRNSLPEERALQLVIQYKLHNLVIIYKEAVIYELSSLYSHTHTHTRICVTAKKEKEVMAGESVIT